MKKLRWYLGPEIPYKDDNKKLRLFIGQKYCTVPLNDSFVVFFGGTVGYYEKPDAIKSIFVVDMENNEWKRLPNLPTENTEEFHECAGVIYFDKKYNRYRFNQNKPSRA